MHRPLARCSKQTLMDTEQFWQAVGFILVVMPVVVISRNIVVVFRWS